MSRDASYRDLFGQVDAWWESLDGDEKSLYLSGEFPLMFSYNSGRLENEEITLHDTAEIFDRGRVISFTGELRTLFEISNLKDAWSSALDFKGSAATALEGGDGPCEGLHDAASSFRLLLRGARWGQAGPCRRESGIFHGRPWAWGARRAC